MTITLHATQPTSEAIFSYQRWIPQLPRLKEIYRNNLPFPHIVLDHSLSEDAAENALKEFPQVDSETWIHYIHVNERKFGKTDLSSFEPTLQAVIQELNSERFLHFLSELSGIKGLFADPTLEGGGLHQSGRGGFLNIHADFTAHPHHRDWQRRINVLVYLNRDWKSNWGGHLELWDKCMKKKVRKIAPFFNRCVIFNTDADAFHGHPQPLTCPEGVTRKSIALYYFTKESNLFVRSTEYKARPNDGVKSVFIFFDKWVLRIYDHVKRRTGINDRLASKMLSILHRIKTKAASFFKQK